MAHLIRTEAAARLELRGRTATQLLDGSTPGAGMTVRIVDVDPELPGSDARPLHVHDDVGEFIYLLGGSGVLHCNDGTIAAEAGQGVYVPPGERHKIVPSGAEPLRLLCVFATGDIAAGTRE